MSKIFVSIASYRDIELCRTIDDLFLNAKNPDDIVVGIYNQIDMREDKLCIVHAQHYGLDKVRQAVIPIEVSFGVGHARSIILESMTSKEDFYFQIDSHTRFATHWDEKALEQWAQCEDPNAVLTAYPPPYEPNTDLPPLDPVKMYIKGFKTSGLPIVEHHVLPKADVPDKPFRHGLLAGGCIFCPLLVMKDVKYDPFIYFDGEEITLAARLYTHGYNLYNPVQPFIWHYYGRQEGKRHWNDRPDWLNMSIHSVDRVRYIMGIIDEAPLASSARIEEFLLGGERTLDQYASEFLVDLRGSLVKSDLEIKFASDDE